MDERLLSAKLDPPNKHNCGMYMYMYNGHDRWIICIASDRLGELERDKARLTEQLVAQQREHLPKSGKSKNLLKRLKGKIHPSGPSYGLGMPQDGSISSSQSQDIKDNVEPPDRYVVIQWGALIRIHIVSASLKLLRNAFFNLLQWCCSCYTYSQGPHSRG